MQQRNIKTRKSSLSPPRKATRGQSTRKPKKHVKKSKESDDKTVKTVLTLIVVLAFIYLLKSPKVSPAFKKELSAKEQLAKQIGGSIRANAMNRFKTMKNDVKGKIEQGKQKIDSISAPHLNPPVPYLPIFSKIPNSEALIQDVLNGKPTIAGITALLQKYLDDFHNDNMRLSANRASPADILDSFYTIANRHLKPFDEAYRNKPIFPIREDDSIFLSLASYREHLLKDTLVYAFENAKHPEKLFIGAVVQNCFGRVLPDGTIDPSGKPCKTGMEVIGKNAQGRDMTKISDAPVDKNGIEDFCTDEKYKHFCENGQVRVVYVHETESLGPAMARYHASKLWGGETFFMQCDSRK